MASSLNILSKIVSSKVSGILKTDEEEKEPPTEKELKEEEKRRNAIKAVELERKKQHIDEEYQREKKRQEIRDKYGIAKKADSGKDKQKVLKDMKKEYNLSEEEARELQQKMCQVRKIFVSGDKIFIIHNENDSCSNSTSCFRIRMIETRPKLKSRRKWRRGR